MAQVINLLRKGLFFAFKKIIPINWLIGAMENERINQYAQQCTKDKTAILHKDARIINLRNDPQKIQIGKDTLIRGELFVNHYGGEIIIGNYSSIGEHSRIWSGNRVTIGNYVQISHNVNIIDTNTHSLNAYERQDEYRQVLEKGYIEGKNISTNPIIIEDHVWISFNVSILKGVTIGEGAIVAANSLIIKDVPHYTLVGGMPAEVIKILK